MAVMEWKGERREVPPEMVARMQSMGATVVAAAPAPGPDGQPAPEGQGIGDRLRAAAQQFQTEQAPTSEALRQGTARGLTLGFDDVAAGVGAYLGDLVARQEASDEQMLSGGGESLMDSARAAAPAFQQGQEERRAVVDEARRGDEAAFGAGELMGMLLVPGGTGVKGAAAQGALAGAGFSDADTLEDAGKSAALGGAVGGVVGAVAPKVVGAVGSAVGKGVDAVKGAAGRVLERAGSQADELRVLTTMGATGGSIANPAILKEAANVPGGVPALAKTLRETGISRGITTTEGIAKRAGEVEERAGQQIGKMIEDATDAGGFVEVSAVTKRLRDQAAKATAGGKAISGVQRREADALNRLASKYDELFPGGVAPIREMKDASIALGQDASAAYRARSAGRDVEGQGRALMETRRASEAGVDDALAGLGADPTAYQAAKTQFQGGRLAREAAETSLGRASKNNLLGLTDVGMLATTGPVGALARKFASPFASSARATAAETALALSQRLKQSPALAGKIGPWAEKIAAASGNASMLTKVATKALTDPTVERAIKADIAAETLKSLPPEQRKEHAATAMSALGGPDGFSPKDFAANFKEARGSGAVYGQMAKELGGPADEMLTALYAASKRAQGKAQPAILGGVLGIVGGSGGNPLQTALASGDARKMVAAAEVLRDPALQRLAASEARGSIRPRDVKDMATSSALRRLLRASKMPSTPKDAESWVWGIVGGQKDKK
jgi:hypothetical protein